jgi:hypothetical protein
MHTCLQVNTALAFSQLARQLRFDSSSSRAAALQHASYAQLLQLAEQQAPGLNPTKLAMVLTSMAWMSSSSSCDTEAPEQQQQQQQQQQQTLQQQALPTSHQSLSCSTSSSSEVAVHAVAPDQLLQLLAQQLQQQLDAADPEDVCHCLWAFAKLQQLHSPAVVHLLDAATAHSLAVGWVHLLTAKPLSSLLWVHAQLQQQQEEDGTTLQQQQQHLPALLQAVTDELSQPGFLATWTPQELSMLLWSCATFKLQIGQQQQQQQGDAVLSVVQEQRQQQQALPALPAAVVEEVCKLAVQQVVRFTPQGIANTCLALAKLLETTASQQQCLASAQAAAAAAATGAGSGQHALVQPSVQQAVQHLFDVFTAAAAAQLHYYKPQEVANLWSACARLFQQQQQQQRYAAVSAAVCQYVVNHSHQLNPRDVFELLVGFVQLKTSVEPPVLHALLHRLSQVSEQLQPYELTAAAWSLVKLTETQQQQQQQQVGRGVVQPLQQHQLHSKCLSAAQELLDCIASQLETERPETAAATAAADPLQHVLTTSGGKPLVLLLWAVAGSGYLEGEQQQQQQQQQRQHLLTVLLQEVQRQVSSCKATTLVQLLVALTRLQPVVPQQQMQQHLQHVCQVAAARLLPVLQQLPPQQVVLAAWSLQKLAPGSSGKHVFTAAADAAVSMGPGSSGDTASDSSSSSSSTEIQGDASASSLAAGFVLAALSELQQRQQLANLPADAAAALLWCCTAARVAADAAVLLPLLGAAEQQLPQMSVRELTQLLQALAHLQQQQQQQQQGVVRLQSRLISQAADRLQQQLQHYLLHSSNSVRQASGINRPRKGSRAHSSSSSGSSSNVQQQEGLSSRALLSVAASCARLPQLHDSDLLLAVLEVWQQQLDQQQQQQQGRLQDLQQTLAMLLMLSGASSSSSDGAFTAQLQDLLQQTLPQLQQCLTQQQQQQQQQAHGNASASKSSHNAAGAVALAAQVFAELCYQPPPALLHLMNRQLQQSGLSGISSRDLVLLLHSYVQLGLPAQGLAAAVTAALQHRQRLSNKTAAAAVDSGSSFAALSSRSQVLLLWSLLTVFYSSGHEQGSVRRLMVQLARNALIVKQQQEDDALELQQLALQCRELLQTPRYQMLSAALCSQLAGSGAVLRQRSELLQSLRQLSELLLSEQQQQQQQAKASVPDSADGPDSTRLVTDQAAAGLGRGWPDNSSSASSRYSGRALVHVLRSSQQQRLLLLQQRTASSQQQQQLMRRLAPLLPLWLQQQLHRAGLKALAAQLVAAGVSGKCVRLVGLANGDLALLVSTTGSSSSSSSGKAAAGLAVVLESAGNRACNTGRPLGPGLLRSSVLAARGYSMCSMPLGLWLPSWLSKGSAGSAAAAAAAAALESRRQALLQQLLDQLQKLA